MRTTRRPRAALGPDERPPVAAFRSDAALGKAAPDDQWYSSLMFGPVSFPIHALPMTYRAGATGLEIGVPERSAVSPDAIQREIRYRHAAAIVVAPVGFAPRDARLADFSDWLVRIRMGAADGEALNVTVLHGSPFSYFDCSRGDVRFSFASTPALPAGPAARALDPRVVAVTVAGHAYALFAPTGGAWDWTGATALVLHLPANARYFSVAGLPDAKPATLRAFLAVAYAFPTGTRADWSYDERRSVVRTTYTVATVAREGRNLATLMGLYPHHWSAVVPRPASAYRYDSVRGPIRLIAGNRFVTERRFPGVLPRWPGLADPAHRAAVGSLLGGDAANADELLAPRYGDGTYWIGKGLGAAAQLLSVAEAEGRDAERDALLRRVEARLESWFDGRHAAYFVDDATLGTFVGLPQEFHSYQSMNDHHFHYGYWLMAAAHVALRDPAWARPERWGGMVGRLVADIATDESRPRRLPVPAELRPLRGPLVGVGHRLGPRSATTRSPPSEAVNAWAGLVLWGEATGDRRLRDLGICLYTSEIAAIENTGSTSTSRCSAPTTAGPSRSAGVRRQVRLQHLVDRRASPGARHQPAAVHAGVDATSAPIPPTCARCTRGCPRRRSAYRRYGKPPPDPPPPDVWQDALAEGIALADPDAALARWNPAGSVESGETRSHTLYWMLSLKELGTPDFSVTADTPLYAVFKGPGDARTYLAYNARDTTLRVAFSSGRVLVVAPHSLARAH